MTTDVSTVVQWFYYSHFVYVRTYYQHVFVLLATSTSLPIKIETEYLIAIMLQVHIYLVCCAFFNPRSTPPISYPSPPHPSPLSALSYWLVKRLPVSIPVKIDLMAINCPNRRVMKGLQILQVGIL